MPRLKKLTDYTYSPTNPASEDAIRAQIDDSIQEVYDDSPRVNATVNLTGNQTIADIKTFTSSPIIPTPTTALQASTKKYVDDTVAGVVLGQIPDGSLTDDKLSDTAGQIKDRVATNTSDIATNASDISTNATNIATNATNLDILRLAKTDTGVADAYIVDTAGTFSRVDGNTLSFIPNNTNTGASTINEDGNGVATIEKYVDGAWVALEADDIKKFNLVTLTWNASRSAFQLAPKGGAELIVSKNTSANNAVGNAVTLISRVSVSGSGWVVAPFNIQASNDFYALKIDGSYVLGSVSNGLTVEVGSTQLLFLRFETGFEFFTRDNDLGLVYSIGDNYLNNTTSIYNPDAIGTLQTLLVDVSGKGTLYGLNSGGVDTTIIIDGATVNDRKSMRHCDCLIPFKQSLKVYGSTSNSYITYSLT